MEKFIKGAIIQVKLKNGCVFTFHFSRFGMCNGEAAILLDAEHDVWILLSDVLEIN